MNPPALSGVYEAKVVTVSNGTLSVLVPQVFRDQQVPVTRWVGTQPIASTMGFVGFIGGDPAWPVWIGAFTGTTVPPVTAYEIAVANGFTGDESAWLASLKGSTGDKGDTGATGPQGPGVIILNAGQEVPSGTPNGTKILRRN